MAFNSAVCFVMCRQASVARERFATNRTNKTFLVGVRSHVFQQPKGLRKRFPTYRARKRFLPGVRPQMSS